jgi:hypothetical protein
MPRITISYRRDDSDHMTGQIFDRLTAHFGREAVFRDIDSIPPGADFRRHIDRVLDESDIILAIIGPRWIGPDNEHLRLASPVDPVRLEIETALRKDKPLIPVLVSRAVMPHPDLLPESLHDFVYRNAVQVDSGPDFDSHVGRLIRAIERLLEIGEFKAPQVFRAGDPVERRREAFVPRFGVLRELEGQLGLATGCPGVILYGRRRTGKSTTLRNLVGFLPSNVAVAGMSMQDPRAFTSTGSLIDLLSELTAGAVNEPSFPSQINGSVAQATRHRWFEWWKRLSVSGGAIQRSHTTPGSGNTAATLSRLFDDLARANKQLAKQERRLLLTIDEYEYLDSKIGEGTFSTDVLALIRESIQTHRQIVWIFAGSHHVAELTHAPWSSYLVSARTVEVPLFSVEETQLLLTDPLIHSGLYKENDLERPRFDAELWGRSGIERIHDEAGGWPHLVQLIAETLVDLLNERRMRRADSALLDTALERAVVRGDTALRELVEEECTLPGEWDYVRAFRRFDMQPAPNDDRVYGSLRRRLLVVEDGNQWRLRVPLMLRWLRERG